ncbi:MAG: DUF6288 domain-containing protein [Verrucomicrobiales bacterium]
MKRHAAIFLTLGLLGTHIPAGSGGGDAAGYYTERPLYQSRPNPDREKFFGVIGTTGLKPRIYPGVVLTVEEMVPGSPADGKFTKGEIITGINGTTLKGINPFVAMGDALTKAEANDGKMTFDVTSVDGKTQRKETVSIPVLGAYSKTWPLDCPKSKRIIDEAAAFYSDPGKFKQDGIPGALACLFLLSTGDDKYLPMVKAYFDGFPKDVKAIGDHTWNNGYNGIACAEYYLRTGDESVLPILQHYCDDAKARQKFGVGWTHWSNEIHPGYVSGALMNPAGSQVLTTLLLAKECGLNVDEQTLLGALRYFYRFAGHGGVAYGNHRAEGGFGSNGKDGMVAAAMHIAATGSQGDTTIYKLASKCQAMSMMDGYASLATGHGDEGRGDGIWRSIVNSYLTKDKPALYREGMDRLTWWHDLSREHGGSIGIATLDFYGSAVGSSGPGIGLSYTAPLQTLRITGAPPTKFSRKYSLPENLWGTKADLAFFSIDHHPKFFDYGPDEPAHLPFIVLGDAYQKPEKDLKTVPREILLKNIHHRSYMLRTQAAKALRKVGALDELEKFLSDPDPRLRRAALDGLIDWNYWFAAGDEPITPEQFTPGMVSAITKILSDPKESWYVVDGALLALKYAPAEAIQNNYQLVQPWIKHSDWWLREATFAALSGLQKDDERYIKILPMLLAMATSENNTQPRERMKAHFESVLQSKKADSEAGKLIIAGMKKAVSATEIKSGVRSGEGAYNVMEAIKLCLHTDPTLATALAMAVQPRFRDFSTDDLVGLVGAPSSHPGGNPFGLYTVLEKLEPKQRGELVKVLSHTYRPELLKRLQAEKNTKPELLNSIIDLTKLENPKAGWKPIGKVPPAERVWRFKSFNATEEKDQLPTRERRRFRDITMPGDLKEWFKPEYDDSKWSAGPAPVGVGVFRQGDVTFPNQSDWGKGEFIVMRTTFDVDTLDYDSYRLSILCPQGFRVYLNGNEVSGYGWWQDKPHYAPWDSIAAHHLKTGANTIAVYSNVAYDDSTKAPYGQLDCFIEGLKLSDLE